MASDIEQRLRKTASELIRGGHVEIIIGYGKTPSGRGVRPVLVRDADRTDRLVWGSGCVHNLATYLSRDPCTEIMRRGGKVGIIAKGCDVRAVIALIQESQLKRERIHIIGVVCNGVRPEDTDQVATRCRQCEVQIPKVYDDLVGDETQVKPIDGNPYEDIEAVTAIKAAERWHFWQETFTQCTKCYACREACPLCYCTECITEYSRPQWIEKAASVRGNLAFHMIRAIHLAGRCVGCGECVRACPVGLPVDMLTRFLARRVEQVFAYKAGMDAETEPFCVTYGEDDPEDFIR